MATPTIQFKRGVLANLPGLRAGEPAFTTDTYDLYVGLTSATGTNKFFGSHRYWSKETTSVGSGINLVEGTSNGTSFITLKAPDSLAGIVTFTLPGTDGSNNQVLATNGSGTLSFIDAVASLTIAADNGSDDTVSLLTDTLTFAGGEGVDTTVSDNQITIDAEIATATNAGIASFPASAFYFTGSGGQVGVVTATSSVKGVASFDSTDFTVTSGAVTLNAESVEDIVGAQLVTNGSHTRITATYDDAGDGAIDLVVDNDLSNYDNSTSAFITASSSDTLTNKTFDANGTGNSISNIEVADFAAAAVVIESEGIGSNDNDTTIPTSAAVKDYVDNNSPESTVNISGDTGTASVSTGATFAFTGTNPVVIAASGAGVTFSISDATTSTKGISSFNNNDFDVTSGAVSLNDRVVKTILCDSPDGAIPSNHSFTIAGTSNEIETSASGSTVTIGLPDAVTVTTSVTTPTVKATNVQANDGTTAITITDSTGAVQLAQNLTVDGNLYVNGSTTQVNTTQTTIEDQLLELGMVDGSAPSSDLNKDIGVIFNYYTNAAKKAAVYWDDSTSRVVVSQDVSESSGVLTNNTSGALEVASLYVNGCTGSAVEVIGCSGGEIVINDAVIDGGSF